MYDHVEGDSVEPLIRNGILDYRLVRCIRQDKWVGVALYGSLSVSVHPVGNLAPDGEIPGFHSDGVHRPCCRRQKMIVSFDYVSNCNLKQPYHPLTTSPSPRTRNRVAVVLGTNSFTIKGFVKENWTTSFCSSSGNR